MIIHFFFKIESHYDIDYRIIKYILFVRNPDYET